MGDLVHTGNDIIPSGSLRHWPSLIGCQPGVGGWGINWAHHHTRSPLGCPAGLRGQRSRVNGGERKRDGRIEGWMDNRRKDGRMDGWKTDGWMDRRRKDRRMDIRTDGRMDGWMDGWMDDRRKDGQMDGRKDGQTDLWDCRSEGRSSSPPAPPPPRFLPEGRPIGRWDPGWPTGREGGAPAPCCHASSHPAEGDTLT